MNGMRLGRSSGLHPFAVGGQWLVPRPRVCRPRADGQGQGQGQGQQPTTTSKPPNLHPSPFTFGQDKPWPWRCWATGSKSKGGWCLPQQIGEAGSGMPRRSHGPELCCDAAACAVPPSQRSVGCSDRKGPIATCKAGSRRADGRSRSSRGGASDCVPCVVPEDTTVPCLLKVGRYLPSVVLPRNPMCTL